MIQKTLITTTLMMAMIGAAGCDRDQSGDVQQARPANAKSDQRQAETEAPQQQHTIRGRVTAIDQDADELTLDHQPVESLNWPAMIMPFPVRDGAVLKGINVGDEVTIVVVENERGEYVIQEISRYAGP